MSSGIEIYIYVEFALVAIVLGIYLGSETLFI